MIQFLKLVINNFLSWGENQSLQLNKQGVILVEGKNLDEPGADSNMAGKSSIMEALLWCLYARTIRNVRHDSVVNRFHRRDCWVTVIFRKGDLVYRVSRYRRHHKYKNRLLLFRGSSPLAYRHGDDTQAKLESILGCDYQSFTHTTIFGGPRPFAILTDAEQKKILESFLHFEKFEIALRRTKDMLSEAVERSHNVDLKIAKARGDVQEIRGRLGSLSRAERVGKEKSQRDRAEIKQRIQKLQRNFSLLAPVSRKDLEDAGEAVEVLVTSLAKAGAKIKSSRQRLEGLYRVLRNREKMIGRACPGCGQTVTAKSVNTFLAHAKRDGEVIRQEMRKSLRRMKKQEGRLTYARARLKRVQNTSRKQIERMTKYEASRRELEKQLRRISVDAPTPFVEEIQQLSLKYSRAVSRLLVKKFEQESLTQRIKDLKFWVTGFGNQGVKSLVVREALPAMNKKLNEYAQEIYNGTVEMRFEPTKKTKSGEERELFHLKYKSRFGSSSYGGESSGGRRRVDVCVLLVFSWLSSVCNLLLVDELLDGLDSSGREGVLRILSNLRGTVLVISHEKELKSKFRKVWTVVKKKGISRMEKAA